MEPNHGKAKRARAPDQDWRRRDTGRSLHRTLWPTSKTLTINNSEIDVTTADCATPGGALWTEVLSGAQRVNVSGNGFFKDEATETSLNTLAMSASPVANFQIIVPAFGTFQGAFFIANVEYGGEQEGGVTYSLSLASSGAVTFTAA